MEIEITEKEQGMVLRDFLRREMGFSRAALTMLKQKETGLMLNGVRVTVRAVLHANDRLCIDLEDAKIHENEALVPVDLPVSVIYEDSAILVVNKPAGMPTHPTHGHYMDTLANAVAYQYQQKGCPFVFRAANRLDRDTSGIVVIARHKIAAAHLAKQMSERKVNKFYTAILEGTLQKNKEEGLIQNYIRRAEPSIMIRINAFEGKASEYAETRYRCLRKNEHFSVVEAQPLTGRTHQLRVHFSGMGFPICGDTLYGHASEKIGRQALHAGRICFRHPLNNQMLEFCADLPDDMQQIIKQMQ
ncbi:MAG: RluA family pseudouridine synthase [Clostridiales bacterium]|nr:RluA family pseudouridine synthase [Clostridiales bacterium]